MLDVRDALKTAIDEKGYKRKIIAEKANLTPDKLSNILNKTRRLDANELLIICKAIDVPLEELIRNVYAPEMKKEIS